MAEAEVYLFTGPENGEKNDAVDTIRKAAAKKNGALDEYKYYASEARVADVVAQLQNVSLFSSALFIRLKNAELIKARSDVELLVSYIKSAADSPNTLILESDENSIEKKIESAVPGNHRHIFWELFENQKPQWVQRYFQRNGFSVTPDAVEQILDMVENDTESLRSECSRFFYCFAAGHTVTAEDVDKILSHNREENAFTLFDALCDDTKSPRDRLESALGILQKIRLSRDSRSFTLVSGLTYCFRQLRLWYGLFAKGASPTDAQLRAAGFAGKKVQARCRRAAKIWGPGTTSSILALLADTDMAIRSTGTAQEDVRLTMLLYAVVIKNGLYPAEYEVQ